MSSRIHTPAIVADAPAASHGLLEAVNKQLGVVPNLFRMVGSSPAELEGYLSLMGELSAQTHERVALAMAEINGCDYCLSADTYLGKNVTKPDDAEITANRTGGSNDPKAAATMLFAKKVADARSRVGR